MAQLLPILAAIPIKYALAAVICGLASIAIGALYRCHRLARENARLGIALADANLKAAVATSALQRKFDAPKLTVVR